MRIWVLTDGRAGNENPALGLAEATARSLGQPTSCVDVKRIALRRPFELAPAAAWDAVGRVSSATRRRTLDLDAAMAAAPPGWPFSGLTDGGASLAPPYPDLVIGAGRKSAPIVAALRQLTAGATKAVQLMRPRMPLDRFDLVIAPAHDGLAGSNVLTTVGALHRVTPDRLRLRDPRLEQTPTPRVAVLVGGPSRSAKFNRGAASSLLTLLSELAAAGFGVTATTSRRTPEDFSQALQTALRAPNAWLWDGDDDNPLYPMLGSADAVIVTKDSVNMASEACVSGKPVFVAALGPVARKLERFHDRLAAGGYSRSAPADAAAFKAAISDWSPPPLDDVSRAATAAASIFCS